MNIVMRAGQRLGLWVVGILCLCGGLKASALPAIQNVTIVPVPLRVGESFTVSVSATDVAQATATVDFRPWSTRVLRVTLSPQAGQWVGSGVIPADLVPPAGAEATIRVLVFDAARRLAERTLKVGVASLAGITAVYNPGNGILTVTGNNADNAITVGRDVAGNLRVNNGSVPITGGAATVANTTLIRILGLGGNDTLTLDQANGALPAGDLQGGNGNDQLLGSSASDDLDGGSGADTLTGRGGSDRMFGGPDADLLVWNPGDGSDLVEGQGGEDTLLFNGANASETIDLSANGARFRFFRNVANITMDCDDVEIVRFNALGGVDNITVNSLTGTDVAQVAIDLASPANSGTGDGAADLVIVQGTNGDDVVQVSGPPGEVRIDGTGASVRIFGSEAAADQLGLNLLAGNDQLDASALPAGRVALVVNGGLGEDVVLGSQGDDLVAGGDGDDVVLAGGGNDTLVWNPGDDNDVFEGQAGDDRMLFNGANVAEIINISANGGRVLFSRNIANVLMDLNDVEAISFNALGGADVITLNDVSGTDLNRLGLDLSSPSGSGVGDGQADSIIVSGTAGADALTVTGSTAELVVSGGKATVTLAGHEGALDRLTVLGLGGSDTVSASGLPGGLVSLVLDGGGAGDVVIGSRGADLLVGGDGDDTIVWNPGDGSDVVEGQGDRDILQFNGANAAETIDLTANGARLRFSRNVGNIVMDCDDIEEVQFRALGGSDFVAVNSLVGTDVSLVNLDLGSAPNTGIGDGQADTVVVNGSQGDDVVTVQESAGELQVNGLSANVRIRASEGLLDQLAFNGQGGADVVNASALPAGRTGLTLNGGLGADLLIGSQGGDLIAGGDGDDTVLAGNGDDTLVWNPGDDNDVFEGQSGADVMVFNGANVAENITIFANGGRVVFFRNIASVVMDLNDVETLRFNAIGGADSIVVQDLSGTDVIQVDLDLASPTASGIGDGQADTVTVQGTSGDDVAVVVGASGGAEVLGLSASVHLVGTEAANDRLVIATLGGDDVVEASGLPAGLLQLTADGGDDNDVLVGSDGPDVLLGGPGDDVLLGNGGVDVLDGGPGDDVEIQ